MAREAMHRFALEKSVAHPSVTRARNPVCLFAPGDPSVRGEFVLDGTGTQ